MVNPGGVDRFYDTPPPKTAIFFNERFMAARREEGYWEKNILNVFLVCKGLSDDDVGAASKGHSISGDTAGSWFRNRRFC